MQFLIDIKLTIRQKIATIRYFQDNDKPLPDCHLPDRPEIMPPATCRNVRDPILTLAHILLIMTAACFIN
jgi:hypothetical protein